MMTTYSQNLSPSPRRGEVANDSERVRGIVSPLPSQPPLPERLRRSTLSPKGRGISLFFLLTLLFLSVLPSLAQARERFVDIQEIKTPSGITAWLVQDHRVPVLSVDFAFRGAGSAVDPEGKQGLAQLLSNTLDEGAGDIDSKSFQEELRAKSIALSFSQSRDHFYGSLKTLTRNRDRAADLMALALTKPRFDAEAIERMRAANVSRIKSNMTDPEWMAARLMNDVAWHGHPYARNSGGTLTSLATLSAEDLRGAVKSRFAKDDLVVAIAGDIEAAEVPALLDRLFGGLPEKATLPPVPDTTVHGAGTVTVLNRDIPQSVVEILQPGIKRDSPDYDAAQVMNQILGGGGFGSRLMEEVREKRGLTYGIYSSFLDMDKAQGFAVSTSTENKNAGQILDLVRAEWKKMRDSDVTEKELSDARSYMIGAMPLALSSTDAISGLMLSLRLNGRPIDWLDGRKARIAAITAQDIRRAAKKLLDPEGFTVIIVGRPDGVMATNKPEKLPDVE